MKQKTFYYNAKKSNDFGTLAHSDKSLPEKFSYRKKNIFYKIFAWIIYYLIAFPWFWLFGKIFYGIKLHNKKAAKKALKNGGFIYSNHDSYIDVFTPQIFMGRPKRTYIVSNPDAMAKSSLLRFLMSSLGAIPLPTSPRKNVEFEEYLGFLTKEKKKVVTIFPEGTLWFFYDDIRDFDRRSFRYPAKFDVPVVACLVKFRKPKIHLSKNPRPRVDIYFSNALEKKGENPNEIALNYHDQALAFMKENIKGSYCPYIYKSEEEKPN